jgi:hypothetical protein
MSVIDTPVPHNEAANTILGQLRTIVQSIQGFNFVTTGQRRRLSSAASVPDTFLLTVGLALDASSDLATAAKVQGAELRDAVNFSNAFRAVATELEVVARGLRETIDARRADAGGRALRAYSLARSFNRPSDRDLLIPHLREMQRTLGRGRRRVLTPPAEAPAA